MASHLLTRWRAALLAVLAAAVLFVSGCSDEESVPPRPVSTPSAIVSEEEIAATPEDSPERTILVWWRLLQFRAVEDTLDLYTSDALRELRAAGYRKLVVRDLGPWMRTGKVRFLNTDYPRRDHAIVYMETVFNVPVSDDLVRKDVGTLALALDRVRGEWLLSDPSWAIVRAASLRDDAIAARRPEPRGEQ
jgi:hypothetical protein